MSLSAYGDILTTQSVRFVDAISNGSNLYTITSQPDFRAYNLVQLNNTVGPSTVLTTPSGIALVNTATAVVVSLGSQVDFVEVSSGYRTSVTLNANPTFSSTQGQQVAGNISTNFAMATRSATGSIQVINGTLQTVTQFSPAGLVGIKATAICTKLDNNNFIVGSDSGKVFEIDTLGVIQKTITLPNTPNISAPNVVVSGVSYNAPNLVVATCNGMVYTYTYATSTIISQHLVADCGSNAQGPTLCASVSGTTLIGKNIGSTANSMAIMEYWFGGSLPNIEDTIFVETSNACSSVGIEPSLNKAWGMFNNTSNFIQLRVFNISPMNQVQVQTRIQNGSGVDVAGRILRLRDSGIGKISVENDQNVSSGQVLVNATDGHQFIEYSIVTGSPNTDDIREFLS